MGQGAGGLYVWYESHGGKQLDWVQDNLSPQALTTKTLAYANEYCGSTSKGAGVGVLDEQNIRKAAALDSGVAGAVSNARGQGGAMTGNEAGNVARLVRVQAAQALEWL